MPSVTKLAISGSKKYKGKLSARPKGTGTSEIPGTLYDIGAKLVWEYIKYKYKLVDKILNGKGDKICLINW